MPEKLKDNSDEHEVLEEAHSRGGGDTSNEEQEKIAIGIATMTRRAFGKVLRDVVVGVTAGAIGGTIAGVAVWSTRDDAAAYQKYKERNAQQKRKEERARELFEQLFGGPGELRHS